MVMTRGAQRKKEGKPLKAPSYAKTGGKKELTTKDGHWSGAKKGGARGDSFLANAGSTLFVLAIILTTPFIAVIVYVRSIATRFTESHGDGMMIIIIIIDDRWSTTATPVSESFDAPRDARAHSRSATKPNVFPSSVDS